MLIFTNRSENLGLILPMNALAQLHLHHPPPSDFDFIINVMDCLIGRCPPYLIANYLGSIFSGLFEWQHRNGILVVGIDYELVRYRISFCFCFKSKNLNYERIFFTQTKCFHQIAWNRLPNQLWIAGEFT